MGRITVLGAGSWGTTLGVVYARHGHDVMLWDRDATRAQAMQQNHENVRYLPGIRFPDQLTVTAEMDAAIDGSSLLILAVPAQAIRALAARIGPLMPPEAIVVIAAKGLEIGTCRRMTEVVAECLRPRQRRGIAVLSGPNLAGEIVREL